MATARSWRCSMCDVNWPLADGFKQCPDCEAETWKNDDTPIEFSVANARLAARGERERLAVAEAEERAKLYEKFEDYYVEHAVKEFRVELEAL